MKLVTSVIFSIFLPTQQATKFRKTANLALRQRRLYGKPRLHNTGKEIDPETGLYYFGARYLDPKASRWLSGDPAVSEYIPSAPVNDEARKRNGSLPGMGGVFNYVNLHVYHYAGNNPVKYTDSDGKMQNDPDGFVVFNSLLDTIHNAWQNGGYSSWAQAAATIGVLHYYDSDGNWIVEGILEGSVLMDKVLPPTLETRNAYLITNYPRIIEAEVYEMVAMRINENNSTDLSGIRDEIIGEILGKLGGSFLSLGFSLLTTTPDSLGITGQTKLLRDARANSNALRQLQMMEISKPVDFSTREETRSHVDNSIAFRNKPYIDD